MKHYVAATAALAIALGAPLAAWMAHPEPVRFAYKHCTGVVLDATAIPWGNAAERTSGAVTGVVRPEAKRHAIPKSAGLEPECQWHWRDLVQGSGQVYACE